MVNTINSDSGLENSGNNSCQANSKQERRYYLDWLRVFCVILLIYFHTAAIFYFGSLGEFYIRNERSSREMIAFVLFVHQWHMPLFFLLSGAASWFALEKRTAMQYITERCWRLFIPFVFGTLVLVPPEVYYRLLSNPNYHDSYFQFYPQFFNGIRPVGNFEWGHLWFLIYLFTFSMLALPLFMYLKAAGQGWLSKLATLVDRNGRAVFLLALPLAVVEGALRPHWPGFQNLYNDWANFLLYLLYFIYGYVICSDDRFEQTVVRNLKPILGIAFTSIIILFGLWESDILPERGYCVEYILYQMLRGINSWFWVITFLGLGRKYLNFNSKVLQYLNEGSYPIYLLHQTVLVPLGFYVVQWRTGVMEKFWLLSTVCLIVTIALYDLLVKRNLVLRFLFGLKLKSHKPT